MRQISFLVVMATALPLRAHEPRSADPAAKDENQPVSASDKRSEPESPKPTELSGVFEAVRSAELMVDHDHLTDLKLERILPHGTTVKKGAIVVWFETEDSDDKLRTAETDLKLAQLQLEADEFAYEQFLESQKLDRAAAKRARDYARRDYDHFMKTQLEREIAGAEQDLKSAEFSVESAMEELNQLTQMYEEDDLTEQSEEIVLRRAKFAYESAMHRLTDSKIRIKRSLNELIPRSETSQKETLDRALMAFDNAMHELDNARRKRDLEIDRSRRDFQKKKRDFEQMREERNCMVLRAPHGGVVLHGKLSRGTLPAKPVEWLPGSKVAVRTVIATLADPVKLQIRIDLPEEHLSAMRAAKVVTVNAKARPDEKFGAKVETVADVPYSPGKFDCVVAVPKKNAEGIQPCMSCTVTIEKEVE
jgi:multidrug efflux pump subunit AcrA (membrane-fusion protein)